MILNFQKTQRILNFLHTVVHYEKAPIQIYWNFYHQKKKKKKKKKKKMKIFR